MIKWRGYLIGIAFITLGLLREYHLSNDVFVQIALLIGLIFMGLTFSLKD